MNASATRVSSSSSAPSLWDDQEIQSLQPVVVAADPVQRSTLTLKKKVIVTSAYDVPKSVLTKTAQACAQDDLLSHLNPIQPSGTDYFVTNARSHIPSAPEMTDFEDSTDRQETDDLVGLPDDATLDHQNRSAEFSERQIQVFHRQALDENLSYLLSTDIKASVWKEKIAILQWVFAQDFINGRSARSITGSFVNCCIASRVDPSEFRAKLLQVEVVRQLLIAFKFATESTLPARRHTVYYKGYNPFAEDALDDNGNEFEPEERTTYQFAGM